jgi:hypothetical protein
MTPAVSIMIERAMASQAMTLPRSRLRWIWVNAIVAWERAHHDLIRTFGDPGSLANGWVSVTGLLSVYQRPRSTTVTPQIELRNAQSIGPVTAAQAAAMLAATGTFHQQTPQRRPR